MIFNNIKKEKVKELEFEAIKENIITINNNVKDIKETINKLNKDIKNIEEKINQLSTDIEINNFDINKKLDKKIK